MAKYKKNDDSSDGYEYVISNLYDGKDVLTIIDGERVNITGKEPISRPRAATKDRAEGTIEYPIATPAQRKRFWEIAVLRDKNGKPIEDANGEPISKQKAIIRRKIDNGESNSTSNG